MGDMAAEAAASGAGCSSAACSAAEGVITIIITDHLPVGLAAEASEALAEVAVPAAGAQAAADLAVEAASAEAAVPAAAEPVGADNYLKYFEYLCDKGELCNICYLTWMEP